MPRFYDSCDLLFFLNVILAEVCRHLRIFTGQIRHIYFKHVCCPFVHQIYGHVIL